jgi:hypothetical protein
MLMQQQFGLVSNGRDAVDRIRQMDAQTSEYASLESANDKLAMSKVSDRLRPVVVDCDRGEEHFQTIHRALARLERSSTIELEDLLQQTQDRLPRSATVLVILQEVTDRAALALGLLRRQGYSVSAIVNNYDSEPYRDAVGRLLANHIAVYHLHDEESIHQICKSLVLKY